MSFLRKGITRVTRGGVNQAYRELFDTPAGQVVLNDLVRFCNVLSATNGDLIEEGKRVVALHILGHLRLRPEDLNLYYEREVIGGTGEGPE